MTNETVLERKERLWAHAREVLAKIDKSPGRCTCPECNGETTMSTTEPMGGSTQSAAEIATQRLAADARARAKLVDAPKHKTQPFDPQREPSPPKVLTIHEQMAAMSDIDLARVAAESELPTVNTNSSEDFQRLADGRAARAEIFKRALRKPIPMPMGAV
jgi:hypothetical protein